MGEILFWKVFHNKYLFNYIFNQIHTNEFINQKQLQPYNEYQFCKKKFKYIDSLWWMIIKKQYSLIMYKIKVGDYIQIDSGSIGLIMDKMISGDNDEVKLFFENLLGILLENKSIPKNLHHSLLPLSSPRFQTKVIKFVSNKIKNNDFYNIDEMVCGGDGIDHNEININDNGVDGNENVNGEANTNGVNGNENGNGEANTDGVNVNGEANTNDGNGIGNGNGEGQNLNLNQKEHLIQNFRYLFSNSSGEVIDLVLKEFCSDVNGKIKKIFLDAIQDIQSNLYLLSHISYNNSEGIMEYCFNHPQLKELLFPPNLPLGNTKMDIVFNIKQIPKMDPIYLNKILDFYAFGIGNGKLLNSFKVYKIFNSFDKILVAFRIYYLYGIGGNEITAKEIGKCIPDEVQKQINSIKENENYDQDIKVKELSKLFIQLLKIDKFYRYYLIKYDEAIKGINDQLVGEICIETLSFNLLEYLIDNPSNFKSEALKKRPNLTQLEVSIVHPIPLERIIKFYSLYIKQQDTIIIYECQEFKNLILSTTPLEMFNSLFSDITSSYFQLIKPWFNKYSEQEDILIKDESIIDWISNNKGLHSHTQKLIIKGYLYMESSKLVQYALKRFEKKVNIPKHLICTYPYINAIVNCDIQELKCLDQIIGDNSKISLPFNTSINKLTDNLFTSFKNHSNQELIKLIEYLNQNGFKKFSIYLLQSILNKVIEYNEYQLTNESSNNQPLIINFDSGIPFQLSIELLIMASVNSQFEMVNYILKNFNSLESNLDKINEVCKTSSLKECKIGIPTSKEPEIINDQTAADNSIKIVQLLLELYSKSTITIDSPTTTSTIVNNKSTTKHIVIEKLINTIYYKFVQILNTTFQQIKFLHNLIEENGFKLNDNTSHFLVHYCRIRSLKLYKYINDNIYGLRINVNYNSKFQSQVVQEITINNSYYEYFIGNEQTTLDSIIELLFKSHIYYYKDGSFNTEVIEEAQLQFDQLNKDLIYLIVVGRFELLFQILKSIKNQQSILNQDSIFQLQDTFHQTLLKNFTLDIFNCFANYFNDMEILIQFIDSINIKGYSATLFENLVKFGRIDAIEYLIDNKLHTIENPKSYINQVNNNNLFSVEKLLKNKYK